MLPSLRVWIWDFYRIIFCRNNQNNDTRPSVRGWVEHLPYKLNPSKWSISVILRNFLHLGHIREKWTYLGHHCFRVCFFFFFSRRNTQVTVKINLESYNTNRSLIPKHFLLKFFFRNNSIQKAQVNNWISTFGLCKEKRFLPHPLLKVINRSYTE